METVTHVAAPFIGIGDRCIQRCACCGEKLLDSKNAVAPVGPNGEQPTFSTWPNAGLVRVTPGNPTAYTLVGDFCEIDELPDDFCISLVEE